MTKPALGAETEAAGRPRSVLGWVRLVECLLPGLVVVAAVLVLRGPSLRQGFTIDESRWISTSRYFWTTFVERDLFGEAWQPNYLVLTQPPVARYGLGLGLALQGWSPDRLNGRYDNYRDRDFNLRAGNVPGPDLLAAARRVALVLAVGATLLLFLIGRQLGGSVAGLVAAALALANPLLSTLWTRALAESTLAFFSLLTLFLVIQAATRTGSWTHRLPGFAWAGLAGGLSAATKLSGLLGGLGLALFGLLRTGTASERGWPRELPGWLALGLVAAATFVLVNPLLYPNPLGRSLLMLDHRRGEMQEQQRRWPDDAVPPSLTARAQLAAKRVLVDWATFRRPAPGLVDGALLVLGVSVALASVARRQDRGRRLGPRALLLCWAYALYAGAIPNLGFDSSHYYAPMLTANVLIQGLGGAVGLAWLIRRLATGLQARKLATKQTSAGTPAAGAATPATRRSAPCALVSPRRAALVAALAGLFLVALLTRFSGLDLAMTADEGYWAQRTIRFGAALARGDLNSTYRTGHPGVTVMWIGLLGIGPDRLEPFLPGRFTDYQALQQHPDYLPTFHDARVAVAVTTSLLAVVVIGLCWRLLGPGAALLGGSVLLLDPYLIGMTRVLHPDALLGWFMAGSALAGLVFWQGGGQWRYLVLSGLFGGLGVLTKAPAAFLAPFCGLLGLAGQRGPLKPRVWQVVLWGMLALTTYFLLWPALWVNGPTRIKNMIDFTLRTGGQPHSHWPNFFQGQAFVGDPGLSYYPIALAYRLSPVAILGLALIPLAVYYWRPQRVRLLWLVGYVGLFILFMQPGPKKLDRYMVPAIVVLDLLAGFGFWWLATIFRRLSARAVVAAAPLCIQAFLCWQSYPYPIAFYNPLVGGERAAERMLIVGWGEGLEQTAAFLNSQPGAENARVSVHYEHVFRPRFRGQTVQPEAAVEIDYLVLYVNMKQRWQVLTAAQRQLIQEQPVFTAHVNGAEFAWVYRASPPLLQAKPSESREPDEAEEDGSP